MTWPFSWGTFSGIYGKDRKLKLFCSSFDRNDGMCNCRDALLPERALSTEASVALPGKQVLRG